MLSGSLQQPAKRVFIMLGCSRLLQWIWTMYPQVYTIAGMLLPKLCSSENPCWWQALQKFNHKTLHRVHHMSNPFHLTLRPVEVDKCADWQNCTSQKRLNRLMLKCQLHKQVSGMLSVLAQTDPHLEKQCSNISPAGTSCRQDAVAKAASSVNSSALKARRHLCTPQAFRDRYTIVEAKYVSSAANSFD